METQSIKKGALIGFFYLGRPTALYTVNEVTSKYVTDETGHKYQNQIGANGKLEDFKPLTPSTDGKALLLTEAGAVDFRNELKRFKLVLQLYRQLEEVSKMQVRNFSEDCLSKITDYLDVVIKTANEASKSEK